MTHLVDTLRAVAPKAFRRWHAPALPALHANDGPADIAVLSDLAALPTVLAQHAQVFLLGEAPLPEGWRVWLRWALDEQGRIVDEESAATSLRLLLPPGYDFASHARALLLAREPGAAMELLENIPDGLLRDPVAFARVATERLLCILPWDKAEGSTGRLNRLARALDNFHVATTGLPHDPLAYEIMGTFWERAGRPDLRLRLISTYAFARFDPPQVIPAGPAQTCTPIPVAPANFAPRILLLLHRDSDYGTDTLYDGLCEILGEQQVVDFPWKPTLHGQDRARTMGYPCWFERGGETISLEGITAQLRDGEFDAVIYSDTLGNLEPTVVQSLAEAGAQVPWFVLDQWDQLGDYRPEITARLQGIVPRAWFKREKLLGGDYGPNTHALPFSYPASYAGTPAPWGERVGEFWAGKAACGTRPLVLPYLQQHCGVDTTARYTQDEYRERLRTAALGLCLFGNGFDTVRYWELPAHGVLLLAERPPIEIPHNFVDGESAVFFDDLAGLVERLEHLREHPDEAARIAAAGHAHWAAHHTHTARARQLLGWMSAYMQGSLSHTTQNPA